MYAHNKRHPVSDAASLSEHRTALAGDKSSKGYSSLSDHSDDEDNLAVAISASPHKRAKRNVRVGRGHRRRRQQRLIAMSTRDRLSDNQPYDRCGLTASMIVKA